MMAVIFHDGNNSASYSYYYFSTLRLNGSISLCVVRKSKINILNVQHFLLYKHISDSKIYISCFHVFRERKKFVIKNIIVIHNC